VNKAKERRSREIMGKLTWERGRIMREKASEQAKGEEEWGDKGKANMGESKINEGESE
jgi:hypothetical protein